MNPSKKRVLITGCSSGIGLATAVLLAQEGFEVIASMRNLNKAEKLTAALKEINKTVELVELDVTRPETIREALKKIQSSHSGIDVLVNNAGITIDGFFEDFSEEDVKKIFETNVFGVMNMCREVLPLMRAQNSGFILNIASIAGQWALPQITIYSSTKFAIEGFSEGLRYEVAPFGVHVAVLEPCFVDTEMVTENRNVAAKSGSPESAYTRFNDDCEHFYDDYGKKYSVSPQEVAQAIHKLIEKRHAPFRTMLGKKERRLKFLKKILPEKYYEYFLHKTFPKLS